MRETPRAFTPRSPRSKGASRAPDRVLAALSVALLVAGLAHGAPSEQAAASELIETPRGPARRFYVTHLHGGGFAGRCYGHIDISADTVVYTPVREQADHAFTVARAQVNAQASALSYPEAHLKTPAGTHKFIVVDREMVERVRSVVATRAHLKPPKLLVEAVGAPNLPAPTVAPPTAPPPMAVTLPGLTPAAPATPQPAPAAPAPASAESAETYFERAWQYREGRGVTQDFAQAARWFEQAAAAGSVRARYDLAILHLYGLGVPVNALRARAMLFTAAAENYAPALRLLGTLDLQEGNRDAALKFLEQAAALGDAHAAYLGAREGYARRAESEACWAQALTLLERAARARHPAALAFVGEAWSGVPASVREKVPAELRRTIPAPAPRPALAARPQPRTLDFEDVSVGATAPSPEAVSAYLARHGVTVADVTPGSTLTIADDRRIYEGAAAKAPSGHHVLMQTGVSAAVRFALRFAQPVANVSFARTRLLAGPSGISHPAWRATALGPDGRSLESVEEKFIVSMSDVPAKTFRFDAAGIAAVQFDSNGNGTAAFSSIVLDDLAFMSPTGPPATVPAPTVSAAPPPVGRAPASTPPPASRPAPAAAPPTVAAPSRKTAAKSAASHPPPAARPDDAVTLVEQKKVELEARGAGVDAVAVRVRRLAADVSLVYLAAGTLFEGWRKGAGSDLVVTRSVSVALPNDEWVSVRVEAAFTNRPREIPNATHSFEIAPAPEQGPRALGRLLAELQRASAFYEVRQAAIWIAALDADYEALGVLLDAYRNERRIGAHAATEAMRLCAEAGLDLARKAVWRDRGRIHRALAAGPAKAWLVSRDPGLEDFLQEIDARMKDALTEIGPARLAALKARPLKIIIALADDSARADEAAWLERYLATHGQTVHLSTPLDPVRAANEGENEDDAARKGIRLYVDPRHASVRPLLVEILKPLFSAESIPTARAPANVVADVVVNLD